MMKKTILLLVVLVASAFASQAQLLWKVSGKGIKGNSYIFGTEHVVPASFLNEVKGFDEALKQCDVMYGELTKEELTSQESMQKLMQLSVAPADSTISVVLTKDQLAKLEGLLQKYLSPMVTIDAVNGVKPMMLMTQLSVRMVFAKFPELATMGEMIDMAVQSKAKALNMPCKGFETTVEQAELLFGSPISSQANQLIQVIENPEKTMNELDVITKAYMTQDYATLEKVVEASMAEDDALANALLYRRNENWKKTMIAEMPNASLMVAVGAGHLCGEKGLIAILRAEGYEVTPVK